MPTMAQVRQNLADIGGNLPGWSATPYVGDQIDAPMWKVSRLAEDPRYVFGGTTRRVVFRCWAYTKRGDSEASEALLDSASEPAGEGSFLAAVQDGDNWTVDVDYASVINVGEVTVTQFGTDAAEYLTTPFDVEVVW